MILGVISALIDLVFLPAAFFLANVLIISAAGFIGGKICSLWKR